jgi:type II secretory pathway pseudopilin PulG
VLASVLNRALSRTAREEGGFSLIEVVVAMGILFVALLALARTATVAFTDIGASRQRQTGNQLANQILEEIRGLPYEAVQKGLADDDFGGDPRIVDCGDEYRFESCTGEVIVHDPGLPLDPPTPPLVPHRASVGPPQYPTTFDWAVYVTEAANAPSAGGYRVSVFVTWEGNQRATATTVEAQTLIYAPQGCVSTETHPFGAPCQPYYYGNGSVEPGVIETTGFVEGVTYDSLSMTLLGESADLQVEQTTRVGGSVTLPTLTQVIAGVETVSGTSEGSVADDDPSTEAGAYDSQPVGPESTSTLSAAGASNSLSVSKAGGATGTTTSAVAADGSSSCNLQIDGRACAYATGAQTVSDPDAPGLTETLVLTEGVGSATLVSVGRSESPVTVYGRRFVPPGGGVGLVRKQVSRNLPEIRIGGLPSGMSPPAGWAGYWLRLTGFTATAQSEAGEGTVGPSLTTAGQIEFWNGSGYSTQSVTASGAEIPVPALDHSSGAGVGNTIRVQIAGTLATEASLPTEAAEGSTRTEASAEVGAPLVGTFTYLVTRQGDAGTDVLADLTIAIDTGRMQAATSFQDAPTG